MPQFWFEDALPQVFWLVIAFIVMYLAMSRLALPRVADVLEQRQDRIASDLDRAQALQEESGTVLNEYEAALAEARGQAQAILADHAATVAAEADKRGAEVAERLNQEANAAALRIAEAKEQTMTQVREVSAELARDAVLKLIGVSAAEEDMRRAVDDALREAR